MSQTEPTKDRPEGSDEAAERPQGDREAGDGALRADSDESVNGPEGQGYEPPSMQCEATQLMTQARSGRREAFEDLFSKVRGNAFQAARSLVGNYEDAQDLTQEAFVKAYRARSSYDPAQPFLPWFHRILRNTCFSFLRKRGRLRERSIHARSSATDDSDDTWEILDNKAPRPSAGAEAQETSDVFAGALEKLSARDREIIVLRHYQDLSYKEIAAALSIPEGTVMSRLFHARKRLRGLLASHVDNLIDEGGSQGGRRG